MKEETYENQMKWSDNIFNAITNGDFNNFKKANQAVVSFYVMDLSVPRSGIAHALGRLEKHYSEQPQTPQEKI